MASNFPSASVEIWNKSCDKLVPKNKFKTLSFSKEQYNEMTDEVRAGLTHQMQLFSHDKAIWARDGGKAQNWVLGPFKKMVNHLIEYNGITIFDPYKRFNVTTLYDKIPRPPNAFILYRKDRHKELKNANPALKNNEISTIVGAMWRRETEEIRTEYFLKAQECKNQLLKYYPQYKYTPRRSADIRRRSRDGKHKTLYNGVMCNTEDLLYLDIIDLTVADPGIGPNDGPRIGIRNDILNGPNVTWANGRGGEPWELPEERFEPLFAQLTLPDLTALAMPPIPTTDEISLDNPLIPYHVDNPLLPMIMAVTPAPKILRIDPKDLPIF